MGRLVVLMLPARGRERFSRILPAILGLRHTLGLFGSPTSSPQANPAAGCFANLLNSEIVITGNFPNIESFHQ